MKWFGAVLGAVLGVILMGFLLLLGGASFSAAEWVLFAAIGAVLGTIFFRAAR